MNKADSIRAKILHRHDLLTKVSDWKKQGKKVVFTNGCFDLLHPGHVDYLSRAADLGDILIVAVNSDNSVKALGKGSSRPIQDENSRAYVMAGLHAVDAVVVFNEETPFELISQIKPDVLVKGGDWKIDQIVGADIVIKNGGVVKSLEFLPGYSTTSIEQKILKGN
jgi:D-glycero-beta-D-manno-heptose 1-phosphate adenylyltransferase